MRPVLALEGTAGNCALGTGVLLQRGTIQTATHISALVVVEA